MPNSSFPNGRQMVTIGLGKDCVDVPCQLMGMHKHRITATDQDVADVPMGLEVGDNLGNIFGLELLT
jgi:hypothetical protein